MCPCLSSKSKYAVCSRFIDGLMVPSFFEKENYCFALYELCPLFRSQDKDDDIVAKEISCALICREA